MSANQGSAQDSRLAALGHERPLSAFCRMSAFHPFRTLRLNVRFRPISDISSTAAERPSQTINDPSEDAQSGRSAALTLVELRAAEISRSRDPSHGRWTAGRALMQFALLEFPHEPVGAGLP
jgi:hypothetical protein